MMSTSPEPAPAPVPRSEIRRMLVPTSFSPKSQMALEFAMRFSLTQARDSEVFLFHCYRTKLTDYVRLEQVNEACTERMGLMVQQAVTTLAAEGMHHTVDAVHRRLAYGRVAGEILRMAGGMSADMLIMGRPQGLGLKWLTTQVPCHLVLVRDKDQTFIMD